MRWWCALSLALLFVACGDDFVFESQPAHSGLGGSGQGGEGKTALVAELARWMVRSHQIRRAAFVSVAGLETNIAESVLDTLGAQLVRQGFSTQADCQGDAGKAAQLSADVRDEFGNVRPGSELTLKAR